MRRLAAVAALLVGTALLLDTIWVMVRNHRESHANPNIIGGNRVVPTYLWFRVGTWRSPAIRGAVYYGVQAAIAIGLILVGIVAIMPKGGTTP